MAFSVGDRTVRPLTADEVLRMVELGILSEDEPVELLHGVLTDMSPKSPAHEAVKARLLAWLMSVAAAARLEVRVEAPIVVPDRTSLPEPDLSLVERSEVVRHPTGALLVVEVAVSSLRTDLGVKPALYAAAGVPEVWVVDLPARRLRVLRGPQPGGYAVHAVLGPAGSVPPPSGLPGEPLDLAALLAGV